MTDSTDKPLRAEDETPVSHLGFVGTQPELPADIASRLSAEERASFFFALIDATADAIIAHRPDGSIVYANTAAAQLLGYESVEQMVTMPPYGWVGPAQLQTAPRRIERILNDGIMTFESGARRQDGSVIPTEVRTRRVDTALGPMMIAVIRDISNRLQSRASLEYLAYHDGLTGLSNRIHLEDRLALAIADARRYGDELAMAYIDLDQFKPVNDRYGHATGDAVLIEIARRLREGVREQDTVARLGGDEFVVVFPRLSSHEEVEQISRRLVEAIMEPITDGEHTVSIRASIGVAVFDPKDDDARSLLVNADVAMYNAKLDEAKPLMLYQPGMRIPEQFDTDHAHDVSQIGGGGPAPEG